jgi:hypothetical protein
MRKLLACLVSLSVVLASAVPPLAISKADAHTTNVVARAADRAAEPCQDDCAHAGGDHRHSHAVDACKKWCAACVIVGLGEMPAVEPAALGEGERLPMPDTTMAARAIPIEPGIPKAA